MKGAKKPIYKRWWFIVLIVLLVIGVIGNITGGGEEEPKEEHEKVEEEETAKEEETDAYGWTVHDKTQFQAIMQVESDKYLDDYKTPWAQDDWDFTKFDDEGNVMVTTDYTLKDSSVKQPAMCVFLWNPDDETYILHYLSVGNMVFVDDGTCDDFFEGMQEINDALSE